MSAVELTFEPDTFPLRRRYAETIAALDLIALTIPDDDRIAVVLPELTITARPWKDDTAA